MPRTRIGTLLLVAALIVAACGDDDAGSDVTVPPDETTSSTSSSTSSTTEDPTAAVEAAFEAKWDAYVEVGAAPDPTAPLIDDVFTGDAKEAFLDAISRLIAEGNAVRIPDDADRFHPSVNEIRIIDTDHAIVFECSLDGLVIYNPSTDVVVSDSVDQVAARNDFEFVDGSWKLADISELQPGDPQCEF